MATGGGVGIPVISEVPSGIIASAIPGTAVSLPRYAQIIGYDECAFWGVTYDGQEQFSCSTFWTEWQRMNVAIYMRQAQQLIENVLNFPLCLTWIIGEIDQGDARFIDQQMWHGNPMITRWGMVHRGGVMAEADIDLGVAVDYSDDNIAVIGPIVTAVSNTDEVRVFFAGSQQVITPSKITYSTGNLTIEIPRCRLLKPELSHLVENEEGYQKDEEDNFAEEVDIKRIYNDPSTHAQLVRAHDCSLDCSENGCTTQTDTGCIVVRDQRVGIIEVQPATYASSTWTRSRNLCRGYDQVRLNYQAGLRRITEDAENAIIRLAHSLMPEEPCKCSLTENLWKRDRTTPEILTRERLNCPFGVSEGAWFAFQWAKNNAVTRASVL